MLARNAKIIRFALCALPLGIAAGGACGQTLAAPAPIVAKLQGPDRIGSQAVQLLPIIDDAKCAPPEETEKSETAGAGATAKVLSTSIPKQEATDSSTPSTPAAGVIKDDLQLSLESGSTNDAAPATCNLGSKPD